MKKALSIALALLAVAPTFANQKANQEKVTQIFLSDEEPKVKKAGWYDENTFAVGVKDDGTKRDGYAEYVCLVLADNGFKDKGVKVRVVNVKGFGAESATNLGFAQCP